MVPRAVDAYLDDVDGEIPLPFDVARKRLGGDHTSGPPVWASARKHVVHRSQPVTVADWARRAPGHPNVRRRTQQLGMCVTHVRARTDTAFDVPEHGTSTKAVIGAVLSQSQSRP